MIPGAPAMKIQAAQLKGMVDAYAAAENGRLDKESRAIQGVMSSIGEGRARQIMWGSSFVDASAQETAMLNGGVSDALDPNLPTMAAMGQVGDISGQVRSKLFGGATLCPGLAESALANTTAMGMVSTEQTDKLTGQMFASVEGSAPPTIF